MRSLDEILKALNDSADEGDTVTVDEIRDHLGKGALGSALLVLGLLALSPLGDIPGTPSIMAVLIVLIAGQMALGREQAWLPAWLASRSIKTKYLRKATSLGRPVFGFFSRFLRQRMSHLTEGGSARVVAGACVLLALTLPPLEVVPFGATVPSTGIAGFGLALVTRDGLLVILTVGVMLAIAATLYFVVF